MSNYYNYHDEYRDTSNQQSNDYNYYQASDNERRYYSPYDTPGSGNNKKKSKFGAKLTKAICL